jgi:hypothetical protein
MREALDAFAAYVDRQTVATRPTVYTRFVDVWDEPRGEIGVHDPADLRSACFALMCPWAMIPTMGGVWLIVDMGGVDGSATLRVSNVKTTLRGMFDPHWVVEYSLDDDGRLTFDEPVSCLPPPVIGFAVAAVKGARLRRVMWESDHNLDTVLPVVETLLHR